MLTLYGYSLSPSPLRAIEYFEKAHQLGCYPSALPLCELYLLQLSVTSDTVARDIIWGKLAGVISVLGLQPQKLMKIQKQALSKQLTESDVDDIFEHLDPKGERRRFIGLNNQIIRVANLPQREKKNVEKILSLITQAQSFDAINLLTAVFQVGKLFKSISAQQDAVKEYLQHIDTLLTRVRELVHSMSPEQCCQILYSLSMLGLHPELNSLGKALNLLIQRLCNEKGSLQVDSQIVLLNGIANLAKNDDDIKKLIKEQLLEINNKLDQYSLAQKARILYALAVLDASSPNLFDIKYVKTLFRHLDLDSIVQEENKQIVLHQLAMAAKYFHATYSERKIEVPETLLKFKLAENEAKIQISRLQSMVTKQIKKIDPACQAEAIVNGLLPVDILLSDGRIVQVNGPKHYLHMTGQRPSLRPKDYLHNKLVGASVVELPYFELDIAIAENRLQEYLAEKIVLPANISTPRIASQLMGWIDLGVKVVPDQPDATESGYVLVKKN